MENINFGNNWNLYQPNKQHKPDYQSALGLLSHLNAEELREVLNDEGKFENMIKDVKDLKELETEKEMLMASNRSLAEFNLSQEPQLTKGKQRLFELSEEEETLYNRIEGKSKEVVQKSGNQSLETILALLQTAAAEMEEESEAITEKFLDGDLDVDNFLEQFSLRRKLMHLRKVKADKMSEMVSVRTSSAHVNPPSFYPNSQPPPTQGSVPYPVGAMTGMPMPGMFVTSNHFA